MAAPPAEMGKTALLVRMNELQSENYSLRSRLQSTVEELRVAQRAAQKKAGGTQAAASSSPPAVARRAASVEVVSCTIDKEVQTVAAGPVSNNEQLYLQKISKLQHELQIRGDKIAALESGSRLGVNAEHVAKSAHAVESELARVQAHNTALEAALHRAQAVEALDASSSDVLRELRAELAHVLEQRASLQAKADALGRENHQQRVALGLERQQSTAGPSPPVGSHALVAAAAAAEESAQNELSQARTLFRFAEESAQNELSQARTLFRLYGKQWSTEELERLLHQDESFEVDKRLHDQHQHANAPLLHIEQTLHANQQLRDELSNTKDDLMLAHQKIEELSVTVQLHAKYQDLHVSKSAEIAASESAQQAASEIAFLCDTLAAMKAETEYLNRKLSGVVGERDTALAAFEELRLRSDQLLHGCEEIA
ncbi:Hypothetical protein, putative, partial [Bodo saltans]